MTYQTLSSYALLQVAQPSMTFFLLAPFYEDLTLSIEEKGYKFKVSMIHVRDNFLTISVYDRQLTYFLE